MNSLMQQALGAAWTQLPDSLKAHYQHGPNVDLGHLDIEFPRWMKPYLWLLHFFGALLTRSGKAVPTRVEKDVVDDRQLWRRTISFADGETAIFNSFWVASGGNRLIEFVNPVMGLEMAVGTVGDELHYQGLRYVLRFGAVDISLPEWLVLGHTTIVERSLPTGGFEMDFRLTHPLFGEVFRYSGRFVTERPLTMT